MPTKSSCLKAALSLKKARTRNWWRATNSTPSFTASRPDSRQRRPPLLPLTHPQSQANLLTQPNQNTMSYRSIIVLPDDTGKPIIDAIEGAKKSLRIKMFVFSDPDLIKAVIAAKARGIKVLVMLNPARRRGEEENEATRKKLEEAGIDVKDSNPDFGLTHEKSMVVDDAAAFVKSFNWATKNLTETRDYAVVTTNPHDVGDVIDGFDADWHRQAFSPRQETHLCGALDPAEIVSASSSTTPGTDSSSR